MEFDTENIYNGIKDGVTHIFKRGSENKIPGQFHSGKKGKRRTEVR
jgi:hypothetical protein